MSAANMLRSVSGEFEIGRVTLFLASVSAILSPIGFQIWHMHRGGDFDVTSWCTAYPGGLAALMAAGVLSIGKKDRSIEEARAIQSGSAA